MSRIIFSIFRLFNFRLGPIMILEKLKKNMKLKKENLGRKTTHLLSQWKQNCFYRWLNLRAFFQNNVPNHYPNPENYAPTKRCSV